MGVHDSYGKDLLARVLESRFQRWGESKNVKIAGVQLKLDGVITEENSGTVRYAVEIEAENEPQVRGAILNLSLHPAPKVLLLLMPRHLNSPLLEALVHFQEMWKRLTGGRRGKLPIVCLVGDGKDKQWEEDEALLRQALANLGIDT